MNSFPRVIVPSCRRKDKIIHLGRSAQMSICAAYFPKRTRCVRKQFWRAHESLQGLSAPQDIPWFIRVFLGRLLLFFLLLAIALLTLLSLLALLTGLPLLSMLPILALLALLPLFLLALLLAIRVLSALRRLLFRLLIAIRTVLFHLVMVFHCSSPLIKWRS